MGASVALGTGTAAATTTTVDCRTSNLQTAIDHAASGDTLVVTGTCTGNFTIENKSLTLVGSGHAVLAAQDYGSALTVAVVPGATFPPATTVANFSIVNGTRSGIFNGLFSTLTLKDDVVTRNSNAFINFSAGAGGGVDTEGPLIVDNTVITHNSAGGNGGGIGTPETRMGAVPVTVNDSTISDNSALFGGGLGAPGSASYTLDNTKVTGNSGGGIRTFSPVTLDHSAVIGNTGGGLLGGQMTLKDSQVIGNTSSGDGSGINSGGPLALDGTAVIGNTAAGNGGGIFLAPPAFIGAVGGTATVNNSVVTGNTAGGNGGGIFLAPPSPGNPSASMTLTNTIVRGNKPNNCYPLGSVAGCTG